MTSPQQALFLPVSKIHASFYVPKYCLNGVCFDITCMYCMCMYKFYARLLNAGEMYLMFLSYDTAAGLLVNSCEWDYWL